MGQIMTNRSGYAKTAFLIIPTIADPFILRVKGRQAWMLNQLLQVGAVGFTSKDAPGARISEYVSQLRQKGVPIRTIRQKHGGPFPGVHGLYLLDCQVRRIGPQNGGKGR